jgi:alpha-N-dichloroacetyl-p-aminophenylserinol N-oxygenase
MSPDVDPKTGLAMPREGEPSDAVASASASRDMLQKMARSWHLRAQVRKAQEYDEQIFDPARPDFAVGLLPFERHPHFLRLDEQQRMRVLSSAWLAYNAKTLDIESWIVSPFCQDVLAGSIPGLTDALCRQVVSETLVDESFHVLLTVNATNLTRSMRKLDLELPPSLLLRLTREWQSQYTEEWQRTLVRLAVAVVSEVFISDYLLQLSSSEVIQPLHRLVVDAHRRDESAHGVVFRHLAKVVYQALSRREREFFALMLPRPVRWFAAHDSALWSSIFQQLGVPGMEELVQDCTGRKEGELASIDYSGLVELADELGITDMAMGRDAFSSEGLLS